MNIFKIHNLNFTPLNINIHTNDCFFNCCTNLNILSVNNAKYLANKYLNGINSKQINIELNKYTGKIFNFIEINDHSKFCKNTYLKIQKYLNINEYCIIGIGDYITHKAHCMILGKNNNNEPILYEVQKNKNKTWLGNYNIEKQLLSVTGNIKNKKKFLVLITT